MVVLAVVMFSCSHGREKRSKRPGIACFRHSYSTAFSSARTERLPPGGHARHSDRPFCWSGDVRIRVLLYRIADHGMFKHLQGVAHGCGRPMRGVANLW